MENLRGISNQLEEQVVVFKAENTAIKTNHSKSADILIEELCPTDKVLDYGCGAARNMKHIYNNTKKILHGTDIKAQLVKENKIHNELRERGHLIMLSEDLSNNYYDKILNSHVLNVVEYDVRKNIVTDIHNKLVQGGKAYIEVRTRSDIEQAKTKEKYGNGWKIKKGSSYTYQEGISKEEMQFLLEEVGFTIDKHIFTSSRHIVIASKM